jgi:hypothetical protein
MWALLPNWTDDAALSSRLRIHYRLSLVLIINVMLIFALGRLKIYSILFPILLLLNVFAHGLLLLSNWQWIILIELGSQLISICFIGVGAQLLEQFCHLTKLLDLSFDSIDRIFLFDHQLFTSQIKVFDKTIEESISIILIANQRTNLLDVNFESGQISGSRLYSFQELLGYIFRADLVIWFWHLKVC